MKKEALKQIKLFLFDMDGTLYLGDRLYDFTAQLLKIIKENGKRYIFVTNNSSKSVEDYIKKLGRLGIAAEREDFLTSSQATAYYLNKNHKGARLYVCGTESLKAELRSEGFTVTDILEDVDVIVMGNDTELTLKSWRMFVSFYCRASCPISPPTPITSARPSLAVCPIAEVSAI